MATATKRRRKTTTKRAARRPAAPQLGAKFTGAAAKAIGQRKNDWLEKRITERMKQEPQTVEAVAKDLGIGLTPDFYTSDTLATFSKAQLERLGELSGIEMPPKRERTVETLVRALMANKDQLVITQEIEQISTW